MEECLVQGNSQDEFRSGTEELSSYSRPRHGSVERQEGSHDNHEAEETAVFWSHEQLVVDSHRNSAGLLEGGIEHIHTEDNPEVEGAGSPEAVGYGRSEVRSCGVRHWEP